MKNQESFTTDHISMALKYGGISFIAGAVSHGVFSGQRSLVTALLGLIAFVIGTWLENRNKEDAKNSKSEFLKTIAISSLLGISLGFFSGSVQHFPDSPYRSVWVVPLGFMLSLVALALSYKQPITAKIKRYAVSSFVVVLASSFAAYSYYIQNPNSSGHHHAGGHGHGSHEMNPLIGEPGDANEVTRTVTVDMSDDMRFIPSTIEVEEGETIRIIAQNSGRITHELTLGTLEELKEHAKLMLEMPDMAHDDPNMALVAPNETGDIVWKFKQSGVVDFACLQPGHFEAGMVGQVVVN